VAPARVVEDSSALDGSFDVVTLWDVLEHTTAPIDFVAGLRALLHPGGRVFVCSPNFAGIKLRWPLLRRSRERFDTVVRPNEHAIQFTETGMRRTLEHAGYERVEHLRPPLASQPNLVLDALARWWPSARRGLFVNAYAP